ncbi:MAG: restriction endonuclease [Bacillota bacterium]|nr:restriction endonuclease [Bacillota bacterium]
MYLPYQIREQLIRCFAKCFHYKDNLEAFFISCGVDSTLASRDRELVKFKWGRAVLNSLDEIEEGEIIQRRLLTDMCKFRNLPDNDVPDRDAGLRELRKLKEMAHQNKVVFEEEKQKQYNRQLLNQEKQRIIKNRAALLEELKMKYLSVLASDNRQSAGYELEVVLESMFSAFDIDYRKSYRTNTQQIDGCFKFDGFDYLVEAKCTQQQPNDAEIGGFKRKVDTKLESTRGLFVSVYGFRKEVVDGYAGMGNNIIFMDGQDIQYVLEGRIPLPELLHIKIEKAAQEGRSFVSVNDIL